MEKSKMNIAFHKLHISLGNVLNIKISYVGNIMRKQNIILSIVKKIKVK